MPFTLNRQQSFAGDTHDITHPKSPERRPDTRSVSAHLSGQIRYCWVQGLSAHISSGVLANWGGRTELDRDPS
jgi:hypothetical protein